MKLKEAYGHPSYNKLIKAYDVVLKSEFHKVMIIRKLFGWLLKEKCDCDKCQKSWSQMPSDPFAPSKKLLGYTYSNTQNNKIDLPDIPKDFVKFNELIGNPIHPATHQQMCLTPYQLDFFNRIDTSPLHKYHLNKARQMGFTTFICILFLDSI